MLFHAGGDVEYGTGLWISDKPYIEVEDEPSEDLIGKLGWVSDDDPNDKTLMSVLKEIRDSQYPFNSYTGAIWKYFTPLTPEEVEKYTGYKVVKEK